MEEYPGGSHEIIATPVNILWDGVLMLPLFGTINSARAQEIMTDMLTKIQQTEAKVIILDILGVASVDSGVAEHLIKITKATKLMGAKCIISGISPEIAQTLVYLGIELGEVITRSTLRDAIEVAFNSMNLKITEQVPG